MPSKPSVTPPSRAFSRRTASAPMPPNVPKVCVTSSPRRSKSVLVKQSTGDDYKNKSFVWTVNHSPLHHVIGLVYPSQMPVNYHD